MKQQLKQWLLVSLTGILFTVIFVFLIVLTPTPDNSRAAPPRLLTPTLRNIYTPILKKKYELSSPATRPDGSPSWGSPIAVSPLDETVWVVNPDAGSVTTFQPDQPGQLVEIPVGLEPRSLAISPDGRTVYVLDRAAGKLIVIDATSHLITTAIPLGPEPGALALTPTGSKAYVTLTSAAEIVVLDTDRNKVITRIPVEPHPYALAITDDGDSEDDDEQVYVTHLLALAQPGGTEATDTGRVGQVTMIDTGLNTVTHQITLPPDSHGFPNLLSGIALTGAYAWVPQVRAAPDLPNDLTTIVFAAVSVIDLAQGVEDPAARLLLNDQEIFGSPVNNPVAAIPAPDGKTVYIVLAGSDLVEVIDVADATQPRLVNFLPAGKNPRGLALSPDGRRGYVMNYLSRSVTVLDLERLEQVAEIPVTTETLEPEVLEGKLLFNNATNPKLSQGGWISCASCHPDGGTDSLTWIFPDGPRQTPPLWNAGQTKPWHWSAALDEAQDVEETIQIIQRGLGLAPGLDPPLLGSPNAGRSANLDALAAFLDRGIRIPGPPPLEGDPVRGRVLFQTSGCPACHGGPDWTASAMPGPAGSLDPDGNGMADMLLRDVGTLNPRDIRGQTGFDPPSLLDLGLTAPYLHDGSMPGLEALLVSGHPQPQGPGHDLDPEELAALAAFLRSIGPDTPPLNTP